MKRIELLLFVLLLAVGCSRPGTPPPTSTPIATVPNTPTQAAMTPTVATTRPGPTATGDLTNAVDSLVRPYVANGTFSGSILVAQGDAILVSKGYGLADRAAGVPNTPQTIFRIGSLTKQFTAMAVLQLQEQGLLHVDDPIATYLPDFPNGERITIHHLLSHTSGVPDHTRMPGFRQTLGRPHTVEELIATFKDEPLDFPPGAQFSYSNSNYVLLGAIIEAVSGQSYEAYLAEHIFRPLGMDRSGYEDNDVPLPDQAQGYQRNGAEAAYLDMSIPYAAGALYSTVADLYRWDRALYTEQLVSDAALERMFTPYQGEYGYGWFITTVSGREAALEAHTHRGAINGFGAAITRFPAERGLVVILSNVEGPPLDAIEQGIMRTVFGEGG